MEYQAGPGKQEKYDGETGKLVLKTESRKSNSNQEKKGIEMGFNYLDSSQQTLRFIPLSRFPLPIIELYFGISPRVNFDQKVIGKI